MSLLPTVPMVNLGNLYKSGCGLTWATNTTITVAKGQWRDSTNINDIVLSSTITINGAVNGANGLDTGSLANNTFYYVFLIGDSTKNLPTAGLLSLSSTAPALPGGVNVPGGYDMFRRIGAVLTDGSAHILSFTQIGTEMWYEAPISVLAATANASFTAQNIGAAVPPIAINVRFLATLVANAASNFVALRPTGSANTTGYAKMSAVAAGGTSQIGVLVCPCNATPSIDWKTDAASTAALSILAYVDNI